MAAAPEIADEPLRAALVCLGRPDAAVDVASDETAGGMFDELVVDEVDPLEDDAEVALSEDFAGDDPAGDEDPPVSAHANPAPPNNAAPTPRAMARPPTRPMYVDARRVRLRLGWPPPPWR